MSNTFNILELFQVLDNLKHLKRTGWIHFNIPDPETVASHMYRMAVLAMALEQEKSSNVTTCLNSVQCVKMALVHDIAEAIVGDITPRCGVSGKEKFRLEENAINNIAANVPSWIGAEWISLWNEYEEGTTAEARAVKQLDKLDMLAQARSYEIKYGIDLSEFFNSTPPTTFTTQPFIGWADEVRQNRPFLTNKNNKPSA